MAAASLRLKADVTLGLVALIWGATFVVVQNALADSSALVFVFLRMLLATVLLALFAGRRREPRAPGLAWAGTIIGFFLCTGFVLQTAGLLYTTPAKSAFITSMYVVFVPILQVVLFRRLLRPAVLLGAAAAMLGLYFLSMPAGEFAFHRGDLLTLGCAFAFAGHIISVGHYAPRHSASALTVWQVGACMVFALVALPAAHLSGVEPFRLAVTPKLLLALGITGALGTALAFFLQTWAQRFTTSAHTAVLFSLEPVFAALTSYFLVGEVLGARGLLGGGLILAGVLAAALSGTADPDVPGALSPANPPE